MRPPDPSLSTDRTRRRDAATGGGQPAAVQLRIMTANAAGSDEWVGIDDIVVEPDTAPRPPAITAASGTPSPVEQGQTLVIAAQVAPGANPPSATLDVTADATASVARRCWRCSTTAWRPTPSPVTGSSPATWSSSTVDRRTGHPACRRGRSGTVGRRDAHRRGHRAGAGTGDPTTPGRRASPRPLSGKPCERLASSRHAAATGSTCRRPTPRTPTPPLRRRLRVHAARAAGGGLPARRRRHRHRHRGRIRVPDRSGDHRAHHAGHRRDPDRPAAAAANHAHDRGHTNPAAELSSSNTSKGCLCSPRRSP